MPEISGISTGSVEICGKWSPSSSIKLTDLLQSVASFLPCNKIIKCWIPFFSIIFLIRFLVSLPDVKISNWPVKFSTYVASEQLQHYFVKILTQVHPNPYSPYTVVYRSGTFPKTYCRCVLTAVPSIDFDFVMMLIRPTISDKIWFRRLTSLHRVYLHFARRPSYLRIVSYALVVMLSQRIALHTILRQGIE